ncbi:MAG: hypothetical protein AAB875_07635, partial [Patescibacteria group bacterium]
KTAVDFRNVSAVFDATFCKKCSRYMTIMHDERMCLSCKIRQDEMNRLHEEEKKYAHLRWLYRENEKRRGSR